MIHNLPKVKTGQKQRVGRGTSSGRGGHTVGRGQKGQRSRSGYKLPRPGFEGGQMPLSRRLPKYRGFRRGYFKDRFGTSTITLDKLISLSRSVKESNLKDIESVLKYVGAYRSDTIQSFKIVGSKSAELLKSSTKDLTASDKKNLVSMYTMLIENDTKASKSVEDFFSKI